MGNNYSVNSTTPENKTTNLPDGVWYSEKLDMYIPYVPVIRGRSYGSETLSSKSNPFNGVSTFSANVYHDIENIRLGTYQSLEDAVKRLQEVKELIEIDGKNRQDREFVRQLDVIGVKHFYGKP